MRGQQPKRRKNKKKLRRKLSIGIIGIIELAIVIVLCFMFIGVVFLII